MRTEQAKLARFASSSHTQKVTYSVILSEAKDLLFRPSAAGV
jgi:hypothetical protein